MVMEQSLKEINITAEEVQNLSLNEQKMQSMILNMGMFLHKFLTTIKSLDNEINIIENNSKVELTKLKKKYKIIGNIKNIDFQRMKLILE